MGDSLTRRFGVTMALALFLAGCAESPPELVTDETPTTRRVEASPADKEPASVAVGENTAGATTSDTPPEKFELPYPDRSQLFQSPRVRRSSVTQRGAQGNTQSVQLKGFVNLDGIRAILVVNGQIYSMAAGERSDGIELISIKPPRVTLQRGRVRWTESIQ